MKINGTIFVVLIAIVAVLISGCGEKISDNVVVENFSVNDTDQVELQEDFRIQTIPYVNGESYDCKIYAPEYLDINLMPKGTDKFVVCIENIGNEDVYINSLIAKINQISVSREVDVNKNLSSGENTSIIFKASGGEGWDRPKILELHTNISSLPES